MINPVRSQGAIIQQRSALAFGKRDLDRRVSLAAASRPTFHQPRMGRSGQHKNAEGPHSLQGSSHANANGRVWSNRSMIAGSLDSGGVMLPRPAPCGFAETQASRRPAASAYARVVVSEGISVADQRQRHRTISGLSRFRHRWEVFVSRPRQPGGSGYTFPWGLVSGRAY